MEADCESVFSKALLNISQLGLYDGNDLYIELQELLPKIYLKYKNKSFAYEKEWRIVVNSGIMPRRYDDKLFVLGLENPESSIKDDLNDLKFSKLEHYISNKQIKSYINLNFEKVKDDFIKEIWLGPKCINTEDDIYIFFRECNYDVEQMFSNGFRVNTSAASYR